MWQVGIPAWGDRCVDAALRISLPSAIAAAKQTGSEFVFIVHTDQPDAFDAEWGYPVVTHTIPSGQQANAFCQYHDAVLHGAAPGDFVALLNADHMISVEAFAAAERRFAEGFRLFCCATLRANDGAIPPPNSTAAEVIDYALDHPHQITLDCTWPGGGSNAPTLTVLRDGDNAAVHAFHLHPFGLVARPGLIYRGSIDVGLVGCFAPEETYVVTNRDEMAMTEVSPPEMRIAAGAADFPNEALRIARFARVGTSPLHRHFFAQRVTLRGSPDAVFPGDPTAQISALLQEGDCVPEDLHTRYCPEIFVRFNVPDARDACLVPPVGLETDQRWELETRWLMERLAALPGGVILDLGCGIGRLAKPLCGSGRSVLGVDLSPTMRLMSENLVEAPGQFAAVTFSMLNAMVTAGFRANGAIAIWTLQHFQSGELGRTIDLLGEALPPAAPLWTLDMPDRHVPVWIRTEFGYWGHGWADDGLSLTYMLSQRFAKIGDEALPDEFAIPGAVLRRWSRRPG